MCVTCRVPQFYKKQQVIPYVKNSKRSHTTIEPMHPPLSILNLETETRINV